jgi:hypothetical protein
VSYYDGNPVQKLSISSGFNLAQITNALGGIGCVGSTKNPAGSAACMQHRGS